MQTKSLKGGDGAFESRKHHQFFTAHLNGMQLAKVGVVAILLLSLRTDSPGSLIGKSFRLHSKNLRKGLEVLAYPSKVEDTDVPANTTVNTCTEDQPLVWGKEGFLDGETFEAIRRCITHHPLLEEKYNGHDAGPHGFAIHFLKSEVERFLSETYYNCGDLNPLVPFFEAARHADANAFVFQVLACDPSWATKPVCLNAHLDENMYHNKTGSHFLAHAISVIYVSVPSDMRGGDLELYGNGKTGSGAKAFTSTDIKEVDLHDPDLVTPIENMLVEFRGDSWHKVQGFSTETSERRISFVLEQYKLTKNDEKYFLPYYEDDYSESSLEDEEGSHTYEREEVLYSEEEEAPEL